MYDDEQLAHMRKTQEDPWVMYIIVRKSLKMSAGKIAAQVAHGAQMMILRYQELMQDNIIFGSDDYNKCNAVQSWIKESFRKVVLVANDSKWEKIKEECSCAALVRDAGLTQVEPKTETVICLWPQKKSNIPKIITKLRTL